MTSAVAAPRSARSAVVSRPPLRPVLTWAWIGLAVVALQAYVYVSWFASGDAAHIGTGADPVPRHVSFAVVAFEVFSTTAAAVAIVLVARRVRRERRLTTDAMLMIAWVLTWWHDPIINWLRPTIMYNAYGVNLGSWTERVPGWFSANAHTMTEPVLIIGTVYVWMGLLCAVLADAVMRRVRARRAGTSMLAAFLVAWAAVAVFEATMEIVASRLQLSAYPSSIHALTLWAGTTHQLPVYGLLLWSLVLTAVGALRHTRDDQGRTAVERGSERLPIGARWVVVARLLAVVGFVNVVGLGYDAVMIVTSTHAGPVATYPSYLRTQQCGPGTSIACPGPGVPLVGR